MKPFTSVLTILNYLDYDVYTYFGDSKQIACFKDGILYNCQIINSVKDANRNRVVRLKDKILPNVQLLCITDSEHGNVWVIPIDTIAQLHTLRLGKRWDCFKLTIQIIPGWSDSKEQSYKIGAKDAIDKLVGVIDNES